MLMRAGHLPVRLWIMLSESNDKLAENLPGYRVYRDGNGYLTVGGIKVFADGALGAHGAWLLEPYSDLPESTGLNIMTPEYLRESARLAAEHENVSVAACSQRRFVPGFCRSSARTPSVIAPTGSCSTSTSRPSPPVPTGGIFAGEWNTRSTLIRWTCRGSQSWA